MIRSRFKNQKKQKKDKQNHKIRTKFFYARIDKI